MAALRCDFNMDDRDMLREVHSDIKRVLKVVEDHEARIRKLEKNDATRAGMWSILLSSAIALLSVITLVTKIVGAW